MKNTGIKKLLLFVLVMMGPVLAYSQVQGCTDILAGNYNPLATINDGSCSYITAAYTPIIKVDPITDSLIESSGLQMAGNYLWSFNDGGNTPALYRIDTATNALLQRVILSGATNIDWEDIAFDGTYFYVGDFGNNLNGARTDLKIYKFPLSAIPDYATNPNANIAAGQISIITFTYGDQPQPPVANTSNNTKFDCEAMIVDNGKIHLFTKNWIDQNSTHYIINSTDAGAYNAVPVETLATNYLVTAADKVTGQNIIVLLGYQNSGTGNHYLHILSDYKADSFFSGNKRKIDLPDATIMGQSEGITFRSGKYGYISNEKFVKVLGPFTIIVNQKLRSFDISSFVSDHFTNYTFTGNGNWSDTANWQYNQVPPPTLVAGNEIIIDPVVGGMCELDIPYTLPAGTKLTVIAGKNFLVRGNLIGIIIGYFQIKRPFKADSSYPHTMLYGCT
jgi:hypothetical protein